MQILVTTGIRKVSYEEGDVFLAQMFHECGSTGPAGELEKVLALTCRHSEVLQEAVGCLLGSVFSVLECCFCEERWIRPNVMA